MIAVISLLVILSVSILITRIATVALMHTGLSRQSARFQARSAFTGVGFTTGEAENIVNHPVRRRIVMLLMLLGNAGIATVISSVILAFISTTQSQQWILKLVLLIAGLAVLLTAAQSAWLDRRLSRLIRYLLKRWTDLDVRDYANLLHLGGDYQVSEIRIEPEDWLAGKTLAESRLREEGVMVLGIQSRDGSYHGAPTGKTKVRAGDTLLLYGRAENLEMLDERRAGVTGDIDHMHAVAQQQRVVEAEAEHEADDTSEQR